MSQITERSNIIEVAEIPPIPEVHASMVYLSTMSTYQPIQAVLPDIRDYLPENLIAAINATSGCLNVVHTTTNVSSPNTLRAQFRKTYADVSSKIAQSGLSTVEATKACIIATISKMNFKVEEGKAVRQAIKAITTSQNTNSLNRQIKALMNHLEVTHTRVFTSALARACVKASLSVGFKEVEVKNVLGKLEIIASNSIGQRLVSEIEVDAKTGAVNMHTETIGMTDGSCSLVMNQFNHELKKMGVKIGSEKTKFTGGVCQMSYARMIDHHDKEQKRKKELERLRKLNTGQKQRIRG
jgi:hypothetical protein